VRRFNLDLFEHFTLLSRSSLELMKVEKLINKNVERDVSAIEKEIAKI
jgi:hypothetical protein